MIKPSAVSRWLRRKVRDLNRIKKVPAHRLRWLLAHEGFGSDSPEPFWRQQLAAVYCGIKLKWFIAMLPGGAGKARIGLELAQYRIRRRQTPKALYVTLNEQACGEVVSNAKLHTPNLKVVHLSGDSTTARWERREMDAEVYVVSYPALRNMVFRETTGNRNYNTTTKWQNKRGRALSKEQLELVERLLGDGRMIIMDEVHEASNKSSDTYQVLLRLTDRCVIRVGMSATMTGRKPDSLWPQYNLIDRGESLSTTLGMYRAAFFETKHNTWFGTWEHKFRPEMMPELRRMCANRAIMYEDNEVRGMPRRVYYRENILPDAGQLQIHQAVRAQMMKSRLSGAGLARDTNFARLRMIASGFATYNTQDSDKVEITFGTAPKLDRLIKRLKVDTARGNKVIIIHEFVYSGKMLVERLRKEKIAHVFVHRGLKPSARAEAKKRFEKDKRCVVMVMNWKLGGAALDFPFANWMYFYESPVSARYREQCEVRIRRGNSIHPESYYVDFVTTNSVEESVLAYVKEGKDLRRELLRPTRQQQLEMFA